MTTLAETIDRQMTEIAAQAPASAHTAMAAFAAERERFAAAGLPAALLPVGSPFPDAELLDPQGQSVGLHALRAGRPAVLVFYRGAWCPFCNLTLRAYQQQLQPALATRGVALIAISPQKPDGSLTMQQKHALSYSVLSDVGGRLAAAVGILTRHSAAADTAARSLGIDVSAANADGEGIPMPTVAVVDAQGRLSWIDVHPDYGTRTEPAEILAALAQLEA